jgi:NAD(P)-dependent dehydrogenase (short-subunit alcohol dehydrogenase family)
MSLNPRLCDWTGRRVWLVGASSGIGRATASLLHARGARVIVSARNVLALDEFVAAHAGSRALALDITDRAAVQAAAEALLTDGPLDLVCYLAGHYQPMRATDLDLDQALLHQQVNLTGAWHWLAAVVPALLAQGRGHLSLVSSVAGFRGLPRSLAYGPTKAALINLAEALFLDLRPQGIGVSLITPGFVATRLTAGNDFPMPDLLTPEQAASEIVRGWERGEFLIHFPRRFTRLLQGLRLLPYRAYFAAIERITGA